MVIGADHATFEQRPKRFDVVCMNLAPHVFALAVIDGAMFYTLVDVPLGGILIGCDQRDLFADSMAHKAAQSLGVHIADDLSDHVTLALDSSNHADLAIADSLA